MKIKNIFNTAALRFCLLAIAMGTAAMAYAHTKDDPKTGSFAGNLNTITSLSISAEDEFPGNKLEKDTYYDGYTWYKGGDDRSKSDDNGKSYFAWKDSHYIVFKVESGTYNLNISFRTKNVGRGIKILSGPNKDKTLFSEVPENTNPVNVNSLITVDTDEYLFVQGTGGDVLLYSFSLSPATPLSKEFPSNASAIDSDTFWYNNGGDGFGWNDLQGLFYRYFTHKVGDYYGPASAEKMASVNGVKNYKSYELKPGEAVGFKLAPLTTENKEYRIKVYYYKDGDKTAVADLFTGTNVSSSSWIEPTNETEIKNSTGVDTGTRLRTYYVEPNNDVYWVKNNNTDGKSLYLGGFEILTNKEGYPSGDYEGSWYVEDQADPFSNINGGDATVYVAKSHDGVVVTGKAMPLNDYTIDGKKSVMFNGKTWIGVNVPAGATLSFKYTADSKDYGITLNVTPSVDTYENWVGNVSYTNTTSETKQVWIVGKSENYAYISGINVTLPENPDQPVISENYVWYPVARSSQFDLNDTSREYTIKIGFQTNGDGSLKTETHKLYKKDHTFYRTSGGDGTRLSFKIQSGKKGVINVYYHKGSNADYFPLYENGAKVNTTSCNIDDAILVQYHFDTTEGAKEYYLQRSGDVWFGGFEVLFDVVSDGLYRKADEPYTVTDLNPNKITNALSDDEYTVIDKSPAYGPAMIIRQPATNIDGVVLFNRGDVRNSILLNVTDGSKYLNVTGYLDGATIRVYKGAPSSTNTAYVEVTGSAEIDKTVSLESLGEISGTYYITSDNEAGAYLTSVRLKNGNFTELQKTDVNYIYKVDGVPSSDNGGVQNSGDTNGRILFVDQNKSAWVDGKSKMNVLGTEVSPVVVENGTDFFAVKVDQGPYGVKTGYIKVYFNGGSAAAHKMEELPLDNPLYAGWNSLYNPDTHVITFEGGGGGRGWWFGNEGETGVRDLSKYNKINIELGTITGNPTLKLVVQSTNGAGTSFEIDSQGRLIGDLTDQDKWFTSDNGATFDITKISQIYIQDNNTDATSAAVEIKSARLMNKPIVIAKDNDQDPTNGYTELFGGKIYDLPDGKLYEYPFDLSKEGTSIPQLTWITGAGTTGTTNIAAIQVLYDSHHAKVVEWYVNKDTKMVVGSDDPSFKINFQNQTLEYPTGYDEYVTFYMSSGRQANVSFIMPEAVREVEDWFDLVNTIGKTAQDGGDYVKESKVPNIENTYGKHTIDITGVGSGDKLGIGSGDKISFQSHKTLTYERDNAISADRGKINGSGPLYAWYNYSYDLPANIFDSDYTNKDFAAAVKVTATQKVDGSDDETETVGGKEGQWKIYMRFISFAAPEASRSGNTVSVAGGQSGKSIYYTMDSSEPENLGDTSINSARSTTEPYNNGVTVAADMNCIFKAAQYINTDFHFYEDISKGKDSAIGDVFKVVSRDLAIENEIPSVVYVQDPKPDDGKAQIFNRQQGGYMLTIPTGDVMSGVTPHEQKYNANPLMYLTLGGKDWPYYIGDNEFNLCGTNWKASNDGGLKTYLDSYQNKFDVDGAKNISPWDTSSNQNQNPYTECNGGVGGSDTEDGGMFLQPIGGTSLRFEPEYDGVITVWLRQNGCLDNNTMESGTFSRRPVYVMDENGRIMRRSTIRPTASHYMGINGTWSINSSVCEQRSQVENTWIAELAKQIYQDHPLYASRFATMTDRWATANHDHSGHILYGWWYKGFDLTATRSTATSAAHVSRFEYMEPELLYRSDGIFDMEMNTLGLKNGFAKYGYELPNFQYVRYRIPVKAGKTYYIAGRGTKNGFSAIRFDALRPNASSTNLSDLRYSDNPEVVENPDQSSDDYLKITYNWDNNGTRNYKSSERSDYDLTGKTEKEVLDAYENIDKVVIDENGTKNTSTINSHVYVNGKVYGMDEYDLGNLVGKTVDVELIRTFKAYNWHPIILPFSLSETRVEQYFGYGTKILYLDPYNHTLDNQTDETTGKSWTSVYSQALNGTKLSFTLHRYQMLYANTPAFICPTFDWSADPNIKKTEDARKIVQANRGTDRITFKRVTIDGSNSNNDPKDPKQVYFGYAISNDYEVVGCYDQTLQTGDIYYVNNTNPDGGKNGNKAQLIHSTGKNVTMKGTRVWIRPKSSVAYPAPIRTVGAKDFSELDFDYGNEEAGINDIVADDITVEGYANDEGVYDLLGRKMGEGSLDGMPAGVYIFKGQKVYVK